MFALLNTNLNYLTEAKYDRKLIYENKKLDIVRGEIKSKLEMMKTKPNLYASDYSSIDNDDDTEVISQKKNKSMTTNKDNNTSILRLQKIQHKFDVVSSSLIKYKKIIRILDVLITIASIIGMIVSQLENQEYTFININRRILAVRLANCISQGKCQKDLFIENEFNVAFQVNNFFADIDFTTVSSIHFELEMNSNCFNMRIILLVLNIVTIIGIIISRKIEHVREYTYFQQKEVPFVKTSLFYLMLSEILLIALIQYPGVNSYLFYSEFEEYKVFPITTFLATISLLRVTFIIKLLKSLTRWTDSESETVCEKYGCKANESFAFKAFQKDYPFYVLFAIFAISCICFGMAMENFEVLYWENKDYDSPTFQRWMYTWNAMWFIFVTMTTVGYGDFYPKTQVGRVITIFCCLVGVYFVSSMMVFMTSKTAKNEKEQKAFRLITRIKYRKVIKNYQADAIYFMLKHSIAKRKMSLNQLVEINEKTRIKQEQKSKKELAHLRRQINVTIKKINRNTKYLQVCDFSPIKEQLFDIYEQLKSNIKNVRVELNFLETLNISMKRFTNYQLKCLYNVKKDLYSTKLFYDLVMSNKALFPLFSQVKIPLNEEELNVDDYENQFLIMKNVGYETGEVSSIEEEEDGDDEKNNKDDDDADVDVDDDNIMNLHQQHKQQHESKKFEPMEVAKYFNFLFESEGEHYKPKIKTTKTKILYHEAISKVEQRKCGNYFSPIRKKFNSQKNVAGLIHFKQC